MQRQDIRLIVVGVWILALASCVTVEIRDSEVDPDAIGSEGVATEAGEEEFEGELAFDDPAAAMKKFLDFEESFLPKELRPDATVGTPPPREPEKASDFRVAKWDENPSRAIRKADALGRPMLLLFTALEWNENAHKLGNEVFLTKTFNEFANEHLILTFLDYARKPLDIPDVLRAMKKQYKVTGFPTLLLLDSKGKEIFRKTGYRPGRARDYFNELRMETLAFRGINIASESEPTGVAETEPSL
jgi:hypothetical protein